MSKGAVNFSNDNEYYTPKELVSMFGPFDYDPATTKEKAAEFGIEYFDTIETDGLTRDWTLFKKIWINPPFTRKLQFLEKAVATVLLSDAEIYFLSPIEFLTTKGFHQLMTYNKLGIKLYLPSGRIKFQSGLGKPSKSPAFGSVIFHIQKTNELEFLNLP